MANLRSFILSRFEKSYIFVAFPLFSILSITYIIQIALLSKKITMDGNQLFQIYLMLLPDIIFFTIPLSFIVTLTIILSKLSQSQELIALFSFGLNPDRVLKIFIIPSALLSILLLILSLYTMPNSAIKYKEFTNKKISEHNLNIKPNELGQKFGDYIIFVDKKVGNRYQNMVLFMTDLEDKKVIFIANEADIENKNGEYQLNLYNGVADTYSKDKIKSLKYDKLSLYKYPHYNHHININKFWSSIDTDKKRMSFFVYNIFLSLTPLLVLLPIFALTIINPRYQKARIYSVSFLVVIFVYSTASILKTDGNLAILSIILFLYISSGIYLYQRQIKRIF